MAAVQRNGGLLLDDAQGNEHVLLDRPFTQRPEQRIQSSPKLLIKQFEGTGGGSPLTSRGSVVPQLSHFISDDENKVPHSHPGVGANGRVRWIWEAATGSGSMAIIFEALDALVQQWNPGDRIIIIGYSRGAWQALYLAKLIEAMGGLPKIGSEGFSELKYLLREKSSKTAIINEDDVKKAMEGYEVRRIQIHALCLFDAVSSMVIPSSGITVPFALLKGWSKRDEMMMDLPDNVDHVIHSVSVHETEVPFVSLRLRHNGRLQQVGFTGNHSNMGWRDSARSSNPLVLGPLAWTIQQLLNTGIKFKMDELDDYFETRHANTLAAAWLHGNIFQAHWYASLIGTVIPRPGHIVDRDGETPALEIHPSVRMRGYARTRRDPAISGYRPVLSDEIWSWERRSGFRTGGIRRTSSNLSAAQRLNESSMGPKEMHWLRMH